METNDATLWQAWQNKQDANAFAEILNRYSAMVYATCKRVLSNTADAEDAAQECFVQLMNADIRVTHSLGPWLHTVATRRALDLAKKRGRQGLRDHSFAKHQPDDSSDSYDDLLEIVDDIVVHLPEDQRVIIVERFFHGLKLTEIGDAHDIAESTVRYRLDKGVESLRTQLKKRGVVSASASITTALATQLAQAAPATLITRIGKLALAGPNATLTSTSVTGGLSLIVKSSIGIAVTIGAVATFLLLKSPLESEPPRETFPLAEQVATPIDLNLLATNTEPVSAFKGGNPTAEQTLVAAAADPTAESTTSSDNKTILIPRTINAKDVVPDIYGANLSGTVYDNKGYPVTGAQVVSAGWWSLRGQTVSSNSDSDVFEVSSAPLLSNTTLTDAEGSFSFINVAYATPSGHFSGDSMISVTAPGFETTGQRVIFTEGQTIDNLEFTLKPGVEMSGVIVDVNGQPVGDAIIESIQESRGGVQYHFATSDERGVFQLGFALPRGTTVFLNDDGTTSSGHPYPNLATLRAHTKSDGQGIFPRVQPDREQPLHLVMARPASLSGSLIHKDGSPATDIGVMISGRFAITNKIPDFASQVRSSNGSEIGSAYHYLARSDADGLFTFDSLPPVEDFVIQLSGKASGSGSNPILWAESIGPLSPGQHYDWDRTIAKQSDAMKVTGHIIGSTSGDPVMRATIHARHNASGDVYRTSINGAYSELRDDATNEYELVLPEEGGYTIWAGYSHRRRPELEQSLEQQVRWKSGTRSGVDFALPDPYQLSWHVIDANGDPISDATLDLAEGGGIFKDGVTDDTGHYSYDGFFPNSDPHYARISKKGYVPTQSEPTIGTPGEVFPPETIVLHRGGGVEAVLVDETGKTLSEITVQVRFVSSGYSTYTSKGIQNSVTSHVKTDANGQFTVLDSLPAVGGTLLIFAYGGIDNAEANDIDITILPDKVIDLGVVSLRPIPKA